MVTVLEVLRFACVILFTILIPLIVRLRFRNPEFPLGDLLLLAIALGWILRLRTRCLNAQCIKS